ncbi:alpha/beta fold hydrolase [Ulvibacterium marinum]|uniref:Alpha/beta hydrolase n=1 Tax=Ulvibacterium marinum TaxID=2419782 RepID=A0A3B0C275_9FLAO|nr:alpha/beta hydrolase [Ulvibacterium marinum]RKN79442.1 alpha/beta hydrolase [Ulvibacterium marinum]
MKFMHSTKPFRIVIILVIGLTFLAKGSAQKESDEQTINQWFLSTGDWDNDPQIYVREIGTGTKPVIMLHGGWGAEHSGLVKSITELQNEFRFIFYEQRGSLRSPFPDSLISFSQHINDLELLRKELDLEKMTIVGHSMGAVLASAYASKYPKHVKKLILVSPAHLKEPFPEADKDIQHQQFLANQEFQNRVEVGKELEKYGLMRADSLLNSKEKTIKSRINFGKLMLYDISKWTELSNGKGLYKGKVYDLTANTYPKNGWNYFTTFEKQTYPIGIIIGDHDWLDFGNGLYKKWTKEVSRITMTSIKNAGHMPWIDQSKEFTGTLRKHLNQ